MAAHSNRSPSPLSSRPSNANPKISENNPTIRRSFSGNNGFTKPSPITNARRFDPVTPANSPSDFSRRRSVGKEFSGSSLKDCQEKENEEKDHNSKASKLRSPAKGSKHFMSPTISAASKFTPSPRKKVLAERNDPVRTSISLSDGKVMFFSAMASNDSEALDSKSEVGFDQNRATESSLELNHTDSGRKEAVHEDPPVSKPSKKVTFVNVPSDSSEPLPESVITDSSDSLKSESSLKNKASCSPASPSIAPLDADPSLPPYDPKTNYLSPRPQFLYYKPNPRIEILLNKEKGLDPDEFNSVEDSFMKEIMSESFSDSEGTEESETQTEGSQKEILEAIASSDMVLGLEETEDDPHLSESLPVSTAVPEAISVENLVQKREKKPWVSSRFICSSIVLMFLIAWVSISVNHSPAFDHLVIKDLSFSDLSDFYHQSSFAASAKENFHRVVRQVNQFSVDSLSFLSNLVDKLVEGERQAPMQFMNLTELQEDIWNGGHFKDLPENVEEDELEEDVEREMDAFEEEVFGEVDSGDDFEEEVDIQDETSETMLVEFELEKPENAEIQEEEVALEELNHESSEQATAAVSQDKSVKFEDVSEIFEETKKIHSEDKLASDGGITNEAEIFDGSETEKFHGGNNLGSSITTLKDDSQLGVEFSNADVEEGLLEMETKPANSEEEIATSLITGTTLSLFVALLAVIAAFLYKGNRNISLPNAVPQTDPSLKKHEFAAATKQTEVDLISESLCPSEMSSFQKSASYSKKELRRTSEVQSPDKKHRKYDKRESLASSSEFSMGSPSYGSFTTFERIPIKHANGDEEIITPVRRSSRIRSQVTSP